MMTKTDKFIVDLPPERTAEPPLRSIEEEHSENEEEHSENAPRVASPDCATIPLQT